MTKEFIARTVLVTKTPTIKLLLGRVISRLFFVVSLAILAALPFFPDYLFASIWIVPLTLVISLESLRNRKEVQIFNVALWAAAGVWCGVLWELWNINSSAKWVYLIPFVQRYHFFEMPVVGYAGYLPFGVLCGGLIESLIKEGQNHAIGHEDT